MRKIVVGVMGPGEGAIASDREMAYQLGKLIAEAGWVLLTGGRKTGVMEAASRGAKAAGGFVVGVLPGNDTRGVSEAVDLAIVTDLGNGRNNINVLSCDGIIACGMGLGTASEVALALKNGKMVVLLNCDRITREFWLRLGGGKVAIAETPDEAIAWVENAIATS
ncbi:MAG: TIGR00725 family protein [Cyanobacteriota bacterium]|nr:TIGR00725 family protein [Cyanobacteriota bacterium]